MNSEETQALEQNEKRLCELIQILGIWKLDARKVLTWFTSNGRIFQKNKSEKCRRNDICIIRTNGIVREDLKK